MPPDTGEGMQNFCSHFTRWVKIIPTTSANAPTPADCNISSDIAFIMSLSILNKDGRFLAHSFYSSLFSYILRSFIPSRTQQILENHAKVRK